MVNENNWIEEMQEKKEKFVSKYGKVFLQWKPYKRIFLIELNKSFNEI